MFNWLRKRREIKKIKAIRANLDKAVGELETIRDRTIIGESLEEFHITETIVNLYKVIEEIDKEVDDRTRVRKSIFQEKDCNEHEI
jgi:hypothetical protein